MDDDIMDEDESIDLDSPYGFLPGPSLDDRIRRIVREELNKPVTVFAGSGLTVNITGIDPTDSTALAGALGWLQRTVT